MAIIVFLDCDDADDDALSTFLLSQPLDPHTLPNHQVVIPIGPMPPEALAAYTSLITRHGLAIRAYSGKPLDEGRGTCSMGFELGGDSQEVPALCVDLDSVRGVLRWQVYCTWEPPPLLKPASA